MIAIYYIGSLAHFLIDFPIAQNMRQGITLKGHLQNIANSNLFIRWNISSEDKQHGFQRMFKFDQHT